MTAHSGTSLQRGVRGGVRGRVRGGVRGGSGGNRGGLEGGQRGVRGWSEGERGQHVNNYSRIAHLGGCVCTYQLTTAPIPMIA